MKNQGISVHNVQGLTEITRGERRNTSTVECLLESSLLAADCRCAKKGPQVLKGKPAGQERVYSLINSDRVA